MKTNFKHKCWYLVILALLVTSQATADTATFSWVSGGTMTSATGTQGQITLTGAANSASSAPGVTSNTLRLYAHRNSGNGASATFTASSGYQITAFTVTSSNGGTILKYGINDAAPSTTFSWSSGSSTISNLTANSFTLKNCQNSGNSNTTIQIASVVITYESTSSCSAPATMLSITSANTATVGTPLSLTTSGGNGETVTWSVTNGAGSATVEGSTLNPTGAGTVTITATQPDGATYCGKEVTQIVTISRAAATITLSEAGETSNVSGTHYGGDSYTLPSTTSATCGTKVLVGWSKVTITETDTKPTSNFYEKGASVTLAAGSNTFYAVFATASGGGSSSGSATLVSSSSSTYYSSGYITGVSGTNCATWTTDAFTMTQNKNNSSSAVSLSYAEIRVYASHSLVFSPASGTEITSIVVTANSESYATALGGSSTSNCTKSVSSSTVTITPTDGTEDITLTNSAQSRINSLVVNYTTGGGTTYSAYATSCCIPLGQINGSFCLRNVCNR